MSEKEYKIKCEKLFKKNTILLNQQQIDAEHTAELEKENAELKLKLEALEGQTPWKDIKDKSEVIGKLTKAKEIIKTFCGFCSVFNSTNGSFDNIIAKAEQFLNEVEK